jgi:hypothetical protein
MNPVSITFRSRNSNQAIFNSKIGYGGVAFLVYLITESILFLLATWLFHKVYHHSNHRLSKNLLFVGFS